MQSTADSQVCGQRTDELKLPNRHLVLRLVQEGSYYRRSWLAALHRACVDGTRVVEREVFDMVHGRQTLFPMNLIEMSRRNFDKPAAILHFARVASDEYLCTREMPLRERPRLRRLISSGVHSTNGACLSFGAMWTSTKPRMK